jgi:hypothetical protein
MQPASVCRAVTAIVAHYSGFIAWHLWRVQEVRVSLEIWHSLFLIGHVLFVLIWLGLTTIAIEAFDAYRIVVVTSCFAKRYFAVI